MGFRFTQVDVFGDGLSGNPLAVVHDADDLSEAQMQAFASWTNLSETTFLLKPVHARADYRVRIFTPQGELPFAGHPTLGSAHAWLTAGGHPRSSSQMVQECEVGLVELRRRDDQLSFAAPPRRRSHELGGDEIAVIEAATGISADAWVAHAWGDNGPPWMMVQLADADTVRALVVRQEALAPGQHLGLIGLEADGAAHAYEVRGILREFEDPVTGSLNAAAAQWLRERAVVPAVYRVGQGTAIGRHGEISVVDDGTDIWIGGRVSVVISGEMRL